MTAQFPRRSPIGDILRQGGTFPADGDLFRIVRVDGTLWERVAESGDAS